MHRSVCSTLVAIGLLALLGRAAAGGPSSRYYAKDTQGIFWFIHVSDVHIDEGDSVSHDNLTFVLGEAISIVHPVFVFASGDLINATIAGIPTSGQDQGEWDIYKQIYTDAKMRPSFYFDMPGNHDGYGDRGLTYFIANSLQGQATNGHLFVDATYKTPLGEYYFAAMNSAGLYDTPFTFGDPAFTNIDDLQKGIDAHSSAQLVFVFAHHHLAPHGNTGLQMELNIGGTDTPPSNVDQVLPILQGAGAFYMHGHVHQYKESLEANLVANQIGKLGKVSTIDRSSGDAYQQSKYTANFGIGIVDHNAFVYRATGAESPWPFVAITAPVDHYLQGGGTPAGSTMWISYDGDYEAYGTTVNPYAYDVCNADKANPVRALVLSKDPVQSVNILFEGNVEGAMTPAPDPAGIWTGTFNTSDLKPGLYTLEVVAKAGAIARSDSIRVQVTAGLCIPAEGNSGGCSCRVGGAQDGPARFSWIAALLLAGRRRRRALH